MLVAPAPLFEGGHTHLNQPVFIPAQRKGLYCFDLAEGSLYLGQPGPLSSFPPPQEAAPFC